mmetsp:Transcript_3397/g.7949  ORF Transcript_3397/g.7949 Transcript_3397/m.7949 type:complete len:152 (+) Transcript_3397:605-1060(+)
MLDTNLLCLKKNWPLKRRMQRTTGSATSRRTIEGGKKANAEADEGVDAGVDAGEGVGVHAGVAEEMQIMRNQLPIKNHKMRTPLSKMGMPQKMEPRGVAEVEDADEGGVDDGAEVEAEGADADLLACPRLQVVGKMVMETEITKRKTRRRE